MNNEEIQALMQKLKDAGLEAEEIADGILWPLFSKGKMSKDDLATLCSSLGLQLEEDFENDKGPEAGDGNVTQSEAEDLKEIKPGESEEEFKEKVEEAKGPDGADGDGAKDKDAEDKPEDESKGDKSEDEEWEEVKKNVFKL